MAKKGLFGVKSGSKMAKYSKKNNKERKKRTRSCVLLQKNDTGSAFF